jgi:anaerobic ribonucleoside-triphosphate reductase
LTSEDTVNAKVEDETMHIMVPVEVYSRVCGYFRPVNQWNKGKKEEFRERKDYVFIDP